MAAAIEREVVSTDEFPGRIEAVESVAVRARVSGYLQSVHFKPGSKVRKGDLLFVIDPRAFQAELDRAEATLANTRAQIELSRLELSRQEQLLAERATSRREYDDAAAKVRQLQAQIKANEASVDIARLNLAYTRVLSPIDGRVGKAEITVGNLVQGDGPNSPALTSVVSVSPVYAAFEAGEAAYLKYIGARNVRMRALLDNRDGRFTPGLFARVRLGDMDSPRKAVLVADRAIGTDQSRRFVMVVNGENRAEYREVRLGPVIDGLRVIESGLEAGETIVVNGLQRVRPGAPVTPQPVQMAARS